jgi:hypothetical protein
MPITRTPMIDDDGSGTTGTIINNAWKQELYNQIDAQAVSGPWTPIDGSGAGLVFTVTGARYWKFDKFVTITAQITYPATAVAGLATVAGLPFVNGPSLGGLVPIWVHAYIYYLAPAAAGFTIYHATTAVQQTNANMSGQPVWVAGSYLTA